MTGQKLAGVILLFAAFIHADGSPIAGCPAATAPSCPAKDGRLATLLPHPTSTSYYYECSNGIAYCMPCPSGLVFNTDLKVCDYATSGTASKTETDQRSETKTDTKTETGKTSDTQTKTDSAIIGYSCPKATAPSCPAKDGRFATLLPHPSSTSFYYECSNGIAYCMPCPSGLVFNTDLSVCDYVTSGTVSKTETDQTSDKQTETKTETGKTSETKTETKTETGKTSESTSETKTETGKTSESTSETKTETGKTSESTSESKTETGKTSESTSETKTETGKTSESTSQTNSGYGCPKAKAPSCPSKDGRYATLLAHPSSSSYYYECSNGIAYCMPCPTGLVFNTDLSVCDYVTGGTGSKTETDQTSGTKTETGETSETVTNTKTETGKTSESTSQTKTETGKTSESTSQTNNANSGIGCPSAKAPSCPSKDGRLATLLPHPSSSSYYYECSNGIAYCMPCPSGLVFNTDLSVCDYATSGNANKVEAPSDEKTEEIVPAESEPESDSVNAGSACPATSAPSCPSKDPAMAVLLAHPTSCEWYFECSNGIANCMPCPTGEYFNDELKVCDFKENSGCKV